MITTAPPAKRSSHLREAPATSVSHQRKRVLFTMVELGPGGVETNVLNLLNRLDPERFELSLFLHHDPSSRGQAHARRLPEHVSVAWALRGAYRRWKLPYALSRLLMVARHCDVIVAAQEGRATLLAYMAGRILRKPVIGCIQFDWQSAMQQMSRRQHWGLRWMCPGMKRVVACGQDSAASLNRIADISPNRMTVIPNFVEASRVHRAASQPTPAWAQAVFAKPTIVAMGRLNEQKGFDVLVRAHAMLRERGVDHHLMILGEGHLREELTTLATVLGVEESLFLPGFAAEPFALLQRGTVFALSSRFEGLPFAMIEAMTLGLPIVATDCPSGPGEVLDRGRFGVLVQVDDAGALASALERVLTDTRKRTELSALSHQRAQCYSDAQAIPAWEDVLHAVC